MRWKEIPEVRASQPLLSRYGTAVRLGLPLLAALVFWRAGRPRTAVVVLAIGLSLTIVSKVSAPAAHVIERASEWLSRIVGMGLTFALLVPFHLIVFVPASIILGLLGKDALGLRFEPSRASYWDSVIRLPKRPLYAYQFSFEASPNTGRARSTFVRIPLALCKWALLLLSTNFLLGWLLRGPLVARNKADPVDVAALRSLDWFPAYYREHSDLFGSGGSISQFKYRPFVVYTLADYRGTYINEHDGLRKSYEAPLDPSRPTVEIQFYGGSTTWGYFNRDIHTIPSEIARLAAAHGLPVKVTNFGVPAYVMAQETILFTEKISHGTRPDIAVFYDGFNEMLNTYEQFDPKHPDNIIHSNRARITDLLENPNKPPRHLFTVRCLSPDQCRSTKKIGISP